MNENVGKNIKRWAKVLFIVFLVLTGICLFALFIGAASEDEELAVALFFLLPPLGALGYCIVRVSMLVLYGFGELVDRSVSQDNKMPKLKYVQQPAPQPVPQPPVQPAPQPAPQPPVQKPVAAVCPGCGHQNPGDAKFCENCGTKLGE